MLTQNKFSKYLLYAIGEIILVVIGILIALQINTWNQDKKNRELERNILIEIEATINKNIDQLKSTVKGLEEMNQSGEIILNVWENKSPYSDTLSWHFFRSTWTGKGYVTGLSYAGYENLKNIGFDLISNDSIKRDIIRMFERGIPRILGLFESTEEWVLYKEHYLRNFLTTDDGWVPFDYNGLLKDTYYYSIIRDMQDGKKHRSNNISYIIQEWGEKAKRIRTEINTLE